MKFVTKISTISLALLLLTATTVNASIPRKTQVSDNDTTPGYLNGKLVAGSGIDFAEGNDGGDETLTISNTSVSPANATYITQTANASLSAEQALASLATGILKNTTTTGVLSIAAAGTDYLTPNGSAANLTNFPTLNQNTSGNAGTATALAANGANCGAGEYPLGVDASGAVESCTDASTEIATAIATKDACSEITGCVENAITGITVDSPLSGAGTSASHLTVDLSSKQNADADLTTYAGITPSADIQTFLGYANLAAIKAGLSVDDLVTLSGVADGAVNLGTFTGSTIADNQTIKAGLQALETAVETKAPALGADDNYVTDAEKVVIGNTSGTNSGDNSANSNYANDYRLANFVAGTNYVAPGGALGTPSSGTLTNCTGLPVAGITASTATALGVGSIELGHATDTTVARNASGVIEVEGVVVPTISSTNTLTNKRVTPRITTITSHATPTINTDNSDVVTITAQAEAITSMTTNLSGTPTNFQKLIIRIKDDGTARAISWGASFEAKGVSLPTTTVISKVLTVGFIYDTVTSKWGCVASAQEA